MKQIHDLHDLWCSLTEQELHRKATERLFWEFHNDGFTSDDMRCVIGYMQRCNSKGNGRYKIQAHKVLGDLEVFASILAEARGRERNARKAKTASEKIMAAYEKPVDPEQADSRVKGNGRHISDFLKTPNQ